MRRGYHYFFGFKGTDMSICLRIPYLMVDAKAGT